jgi:chemotaxis protein methyltransferase CheR
MHLSPFQRLIKDRAGLTLEDGTNIEKLQQALQTRIQMHQHASAEMYFTYLVHHPDEFQALINLLTINETYFFREPEQIQLLVTHIIPRMLADRDPQDPIRILSAGCSSGEEPYSLAIALQEAFGERSQHVFHIVGGDIDSDVLIKARAGQYNDFSFRGVSADIKHRYFTRMNGINQLVEHIRQRVQFHELNLLSPTRHPDLSHFDIIFFRNVSIYFDTPTRQQIQRNLANLLTPHGILMIGIAETIANDLGVLQLIEENGLFYFTHLHQTSPKKPAFSLPIAPTPPDTLPIAPTPLQSVTVTPDLQKLRQLVIDKHYDAALPLVEAILMQSPHHPSATLFKAYIALNRKQWLMAKTLASHILDTDHWCMDAMLLLGLWHKWQEDHHGAITWFKKAVYAHSDTWLAHYHLADTYRQTQQAALALRSYRTALQLMKHHPEKTGLTLLPFELPVSEASFLCEHHIAQLARTTQA